MTRLKKDLFAYVDQTPPPAKKGGALSGKIVTVPENISVRGWPAEAGSRALSDFTALDDAAVVERLRAAGAVLKGSTRISELGFGLAKDTAAQAVAGGQADIALSVDTMGETRVAAALAGLVGFKPSFGLVPRSGLTGLIPSMECCGLISTTVEDITKVMGVISGPDPDDFSMPEIDQPDFETAGQTKSNDVVIGVVREAGKLMGDGQDELFAESLQKIEAVGLKTREVRLEDFDLIRTVHQIVGSVEASSSAGKYDSVRYGHRTSSAKNWNEMYIKSRKESFGLPLKAYLFQGAYFQYRNYPAFENAARLRGRLQAKTEALFKNVDALVFPARQAGPQTFETGTVESVYDLFSWTLLASLTGQPAVTLPGFIQESKADYGLQFIGPLAGDARLLFLAGQLADSSLKGDA